MFKLIYFKLAPFIAPFFLLTTVVFMGLTVYRGEIILGLQAELIKDSKQEIKVIVEQHESANQISKEYEVRKADRDEQKAVTNVKIEQVIRESGNSNLCFDDAWLHQLNSQIQSINHSGKPQSAVSDSTGAN